MNLLSPRLAGALRLHRGALPGVLLRKLLPSWCKVETLILLRRPLNLPLLVPPPRLSAIGIHRLHSVQDPLFLQLCQAWPDKAFAARLAEPGRYCWLVLQGESIVAYAWVSCLALVIDEIVCSHEPAVDECFIHDCFVVPGCRGAGLYPFLLAQVLQDCTALDSGLRSAGIAVVAGNRASLRGILKAGFSEYARIRHLQWGGRRWWWGRPECTLNGRAIQAKC